MGQSSVAFAYQEFIVDDVEELYTWDDGGWDFDYHQLSAGKLQHRSKLVQLPGLRVEWTSLGQRVLFRDAFRGPDLVFAMPLHASVLPWFDGQVVGRHVGLVYQPGKQNEYVLHPGTRTITVRVAPEILSQLGWVTGRDSVRPVSAKCTQELVAACERASVAAQLTSSANATDAALDTALREQILLALGDIMDAWVREGSPRPRTKTPRSYRLLKDVEAVIGRLPVGERLDVADLATQLDVSERSIYEAFREWLGVGPYEYHVIRRLHRFRTQLLSGKTFHGKITRVAVENGFEHFGRLTQTYRRYFCETPRQTIKRRC